MKFSEILNQPALKMAQDIREQRISSLELAQAFMAHIEQVNPAINAINQVDPERIEREAQRLDVLQAKGIMQGPLHGVPISIKDNLLTEGIITTGGSSAFKDHIPTQDATVVKRLRQAGALILGKTNLPDFALSWETESTAYGITNNPHNTQYTAGGSSGGEAAILAARGSALGLGTDSGGSIRLPAHYCGIAGLRPSRGLIPSTGHMPPTEGYPVLGVFADLNTIGPMARHVSDLIDVLPLLMGGDNCDPYAELAPLKNTGQISTKKMRIALYTSVNDVVVDSDIEATVQRVAHRLEQQGVVITAATPPGLSDAREIYCSIVGADGGEGVRHLLKELNYQHIPTCIEQSLQLMKKEPSLRTFLDAWIQWDLFRIQFLDFMNSYDAILCPVAATTALPHGDSLAHPERFKTECYLTPYTLLGWPSVVVPAGMSAQGLPIGVQIITKHQHDYLALNLALAIEHGRESSK